MRVTKLLSYVIAGSGLFFFGFTLAALWYEPVIDVLGVIVQFLLVFVGLLGIDEWHRQFKFKRKWERLEKRLKELAELETAIKMIKKSLIVIEGFTITRDHFSFRETLEPIVSHVVNTSTQIINSLTQLDITNRGRPTITELNQLERYTKIERRFLRDLSDQSLERSFFSVAQHDDASKLFVPDGAPDHQKKLVSLINEYANHEWPLLEWVKNEMERVRQKLEEMER